MEDEIAALKRELSVRDAEVSKLKEMVDQDMFLPLLNRRAFEREFTRVWSAAKRYRFPVALIYLDLNNMKQINDQFGHEAGDRALRSMAKVLRENCRESDLAGRLGGDEFGLLLLQADIKSARHKAAELARLVAATTIKTPARTLALSVSYGVAGGTGDGPISAVLRAADQRMYHMKQSGKQHGTDVEK